MSSTLGSLPLSKSRAEHSVVLTAAHSGHVISITNAGGGYTITIPAPSKGLSFRFFLGAVLMLPETSSAARAACSRSL